MDFAQAFFLLKSLPDNMPHYPRVDAKYVDEFHSYLETIAKETGDDLGAFRVPESDLQHPVISARRRPWGSRFRNVPGSVQRGSNLVVDHGRLMQKIEALLEYLNRYSTAPPPPKEGIGFKAD